jgi:hypothetical protein
MLAWLVRAAPEPAGTLLRGTGARTGSIALFEFAKVLMTISPTPF